MSRMFGIIVLLACTGAALLSLGCATSFQGSANISGGSSGCEVLCQRESMRMAQYVFVGEYSTACVCELASRHTASVAPPASDAASSGGVVAAAAGVMMRMRQSSQQR